MERKVLHTVNFGFLFWCPGCSCCHGLWTKEENPDTKGKWEWNGNENNPTFTPSFLLKSVSFFNYKSPRCHLHIRDGNIEYLHDCDHEFSGQTIPMEAF